MATRLAQCRRRGCNHCWLTRCNYRERSRQVGRRASDFDEETSPPRFAAGERAVGVGDDWETNRVLTGALIGLQVVQGVLPAGQALATRGLINAAVVQCERGTRGFGR
jgi:hypothetical protein